jgi:FtsH_fam: ATP-dependent metallopeptidase HflB
MTAEEKRTIALHEAGHATLSWFLEHANPLIKVTIVPRGRALGAAWYLPEERQITTKEQMLDEMCATLGGRAAEELFTGHISTGAMNDLERVTKQSYGMIAYAGMSEKLPNLCYYSNDEYSFSKPYSERTAELIDEEVKRMINEQYDRAKQYYPNIKMVTTSWPVCWLKRSNFRRRCGTHFWQTPLDFTFRRNYGFRSYSKTSRSNRRF